MFTVLAVVDSSHDDGSLYPIKSDGDDDSLIKLEPLDGSNCERLGVSRLVVHQTIGGKFKEIVRVGDIKGEMIISDARVAVACLNYNRAGGVGLGLIAAAAVNTARKAHTARSQDPQVLVGQVRYPWVWTIGCHARSGFGLGHGEVHIGLNAGSKNAALPTFLTVAVKGDSAERVAREITHRTVAYRLNHGDVTDEMRMKLEALLEEDPLIRDSALRKKHVALKFPTYFFANSATAYPKADPK
jgi:hypothetical protein